MQVRRNLVSGQEPKLGTRIFFSSTPNASAFRSHASMQESHMVPFAWQETPTRTLPSASLPHVRQPLTALKRLLTRLLSMVQPIRFIILVSLVVIASSLMIHSLYSYSRNSSQKYTVTQKQEACLQKNVPSRCVKLISRLPQVEEYRIQMVRLVRTPKTMTYPSSSQDQSSVAVSEEREESSYQRQGARRRSLPKRWTPLQYHPVQFKLWNSQARFILNVAGRRSGKSEITGKRKPIVRAWSCPVENGRYAFCAPTTKQAKKIFWKDLKGFVPPAWRLHDVSESELTITLWNGATLEVLGLDVPERIEGPPLDGIVIDEIANTKKDVWYSHVRPALFTRGRQPGWAHFTGVPEGYNHLKELVDTAMADETGAWEYFHWISADILPKEEIEAARRDLDKYTFMQEYEASFVNFMGRVYYTFDRNVHCRGAIGPQTRDKSDLHFCFDFNVSPGVAMVCQERNIVTPAQASRMIVAPFTEVIDEVYVERSSNTPLICRELARRYENHKGRVFCYGDASGGARGTAKVMGSDWDLIQQIFSKVFPGRVYFRVPRANPAERSRVNAVNSRLLSANGSIRMIVHPKCKYTIRDLEGVMYKGDTMEIDKSRDKALTHLSDALGYYVHHEFPTEEKIFIRQELL